MSDKWRNETKDSEMLQILKTNKKRNSNEKEEILCWTRTRKKKEKTLFGEDLYSCITCFQKKSKGRARWHVLSGVWSITTLIGKNFSSLAFHVSIKSTLVPNCFKLALLNPLLKKPRLDFEIYANFGPISNLIFISKLTEKVVASQLVDYVMRNDLDETFQSAYK